MKLSTLLRRLGWLALALALAGYFIIYLTSLLWEPFKEEMQGGRVTSLTPEDGVGLAAVGWVQSNKVRHNETVRLSVTFQNHSEDEISNLRFVDVQAPGFAPAGNCWHNYAPKCREGAVRQEEFPTVLAPGEEATVWAELSPVARSGRYSILLVFAWRTRRPVSDTPDQQSASPAPKERAWRQGISLGPVEVTTWWREMVLPFSRPTQALIQGLALPFVLFGVSWLFQKREREREQQREDEEQRRTELLQTWNSLLPKSLEDTQKYYMPILTPLNRLLRLAAEERLERRRECFYALMSFLRQVKHMREAIGGAHFKNRTGEEIAALAWSVFNAQVEHVLTLDVKDGTLDAMEAGESYALFKTKFEVSLTDRSRSRLFKQAEKVFLEWLDGSCPKYGRLADYLPVLKVFKEVVTYETNRPFRQWFDAPAEPPIKALKQLRGQLPVSPLPARNSLHKKLGEYISDLEQNSRAPASKRDRTG